MNFIIDIGNTAVKVAIIDDDKVLIKEILTYPAIDDVHKLLSDYSCDKAIIASVKEIPALLTESVSARTEYLHILTYKSSFPFEIIYDTPETLGMDRIAAVAGAYNKYRSDNVLVIDAGTAVTYDLLVDGRYTGGAISPGIDMRFRALNSFTGRLPLVERNDEEVIFPAQDTRKGIRAGVIKGVVFEINEYIRKFEKYHTKSVILVTGGDSEYICKSIDHKHLREPDLVLHGLNNILEYNAQKEY